MSTWNSDIGDVSEEIHALRNKLSSKEGQIAAQQDRLVQQAAEIQELNNALNKTIHKLSSETESALQLEIEPDTNVVTYIERLFNTIDRLRGERDSLSRDVEFLESESRFTIEALEAKLSASISSAKDKTVATMTSQRDDLLAELQRKDSQWEKDLEIARTAEQKTREELEDVLHRMSEVATHLQDVESERDSLRLQITNLMTDMQDVQEELNNAEGRYTTLQFHQLSNMTNNEATRNLRGQIEELENRVMRRTEQIGIHQHDIKRLETNLRLQEERLTEMTTELEMMAAQKDAMVEDCADARETRDEALIRVEQLEEELESSDGRNADNAVVVESLIATIAQTVCQAREAIRLSKEEVAEARSTHAQQSTTIQQLQEKEIALRKSIQEYQNDSLQDQIEEQGRLLETNLRLQEERLAEMTTELEMMAAQKNAMVEDCADARETRDEALIRVERLEEELESLDGRNADNAVVVESLIATIAQTVCQAREAIRLSKEEVAETRSTHAQQSTTIQQLQEKEIALRKSIQEYQNDSLQGQIEEQGRLLETNLRLQEERLAEMTTELEMMAAQKNAMAEDCADARETRDEALIRVERLEEELESSDGRDADNAVIMESLIATIAQTVCQAREAIRLSREEVAEARSTHAQQSTTIQQLQEKEIALRKSVQEYQNDSLQDQIEEQGRLLDICKREVTQIRDRLQEEEEGRAQDKKQHAMVLLSEKERNEDADTTISQLRGELKTLERNLQQINEHLQSVEDEKLTLRQQMTELEAEVQRSKSLSHYLEIQIKDSDQLVSTLKGDIERSKADLARSEKSWKTAEVNLSLQNAQHKREMTELERELSVFRSMPNLEQALAELEERNNEMEELLRNKCVEIEENDDRALEMLKEKKKLTTKVESLTRKVQNLQAKLAAAKASSAAQPFPESQPTLPAPFLPLTSSTPQSTSVPISSRPRSATVPSAPPLYPPPIETPSTSTTQTPSKRVVSGPSFLPRPKTPERRTVTPVFKARTPERRMQPEMATIPPVPVIGRKRAAPDDFEAYGNLPAQAFTADGEDIENKTPQERKVLPNSLQSGFTPVRNQSSRPIAPSPRRGAPSRTSPFISDLTNSPHHVAQMNPSSAKPSMRSWLGKIRGNSHGTPQAPGMRPRGLFDRGDRS